MSLFRVSFRTPSSYFRRNVRSFTTAQSQPKQTLGFIGLGKIGYAMANNFLKAGYHLNTFDLNKEAMQTLSKEHPQSVHMAQTSSL